MNCPKCGRAIPENQPYSWCAACGEPLPQDILAQLHNVPRPAEAIPQPTGVRRVQFRVFRSNIASWGTLFEQAAEFASAIGEQDLIGISHSADDSDGVVTVWFWR